LVGLVEKLGDAGYCHVFDGKGDGGQ
jgi:hypothetical protein